LRARGRAAPRGCGARPPARAPLRPTPAPPVSVCLKVGVGKLPEKSGSVMRAAGRGEDGRPAPRALLLRRRLLLLLLHALLNRLLRLLLLLNQL
jgi:hypothetical protein